MHSIAPWKIVVAGPGTGKTTLFKMILETKSTNSLTLSFINALVDDLALGLCGLTEVSTLHGYALKQLKKKKDQTKVFRKLPTVISEDHIILKGHEVSFKSIFENGEDLPDLFQFYKERKDYYGPYYGFADIIYALFKHFEKNAGAIPKYDQILVDEFQDFNQVEVHLVEQLASRSPVLLAGDDDQALYVSMKSASPSHIRKKFHDKTLGYESHTLPYCSRSAEVIIDAVNSLIGNASKNGLLKERISKPYLYFADHTKDLVSKEHPKIVHTRKFDTQIPHFISQQLAVIAENERKRFDVLVIVPPFIKNSAIPKLLSGLKKKGYKNISSPDASESNEPTLRDGLKLLLTNKDDNLGWRIVSKAILDAADFSKALNLSVESKKEFSLCIPKEKVSEIRKILAQLRKIQDNNAEEISDEAIDEIVKRLGYNSRQEKLSWLEPQFEDFQSAGFRQLKDLPVTVTTISGSKGLAADFVFITHFDDIYFTKDGNPTDDNVFSLLVALTRARKKAFLISTRPQDPTLLAWIDHKFIDRV